MSEKSSNNSINLMNSNDFKSSKVYEEIKHDILNNTYPVGTILIERKLCDIYNVSRSPIRNALQQLSHEGLLSFVPGKGVVIPDFSIEDILEVYDLIELLQTFAINSYILRSNDAVFEALDEILNKMNEFRDLDNIFLANEWDQKFHKHIIEFSGNKRMGTLFDNLNNQSMRFQASTVNDKELAKNSYEEHKTLVSYIKNKETDKAKEAIKLHYHNIKQYYISMLLTR